MKPKYLIALCVLALVAACSGPTPPRGDITEAQAILWAGKVIAGAILTSAVMRALFNK